MLLITCPFCQTTRPEIEFRYAGEAHIERALDPSSLNDDEFADFLYMRQNPKGITFERWHHIHGCNRFFNAVRDTVSDKFLTTYKPDDPKPDLRALTEGTGQ